MNDSDDIDFIDKIRMEIEETKEEFIYRSILPFCESVVEKRLSKKELEKILRRGMQPSVPVDRLKRLRNEAMTMNDIAIIQMLDKLIAECEVK